MAYLLIIVGGLLVFAFLFYLDNLSARKSFEASPQGKCAHKMETIVARKTTRSMEYLSTCSICGYQTTHFFSNDD